MTDSFTDKTAPVAQLSLFDSTSIIIGIIVGVGIYETAPIIASCMASESGLLLIWLLGGVLSLCGALCYAELASALPDEGGDFVYLNRVYGSWAGFIFAWSRSIIIRPGSIALMAFPFARYFENIYSPFVGSSFESHTSVLLASVAVFGFTIVNCIGVRKSAWTQNVLTILKVLAIVAIISVAFFSSASIGSAARGEFSLHEGGVRLALILILFTYGGWNEIAFVAAEVKNPERNLLRSMVYGTLCVTLLYIMINYAFLQVLGLSGLATASAVASDMIGTIWPNSASLLMSVVICISALGAVQGLIFTGARVSYALGKEHRIFRFLSVWDSKRGGPVRALLIQGALTIAIIVLAGSFDRALVYTSAVVWSFYLMSGLAVIILRFREPELRRPYRIHLYPLPPLLFCVSSIFLVYSSVTYDAWGSLLAFCIAFAGLPFLWLSKRDIEPQE